MDSHWTAEDFSVNRFDLPDNGRFSELIDGKPCQFQAPDEDHGRTVMNITREISSHIHSQPQAGGYACFDLGLIVSREPDTALFPAVSYFEGGSLFGHSDDVVTDEMPRLVIDIASTHDRRQASEQRIGLLLESGIETVWIADPGSVTVAIHSASQSARELAASDELTGTDVLLPEFRVTVEQLFAQPGWWK